VPCGLGELCGAAATAAAAAAAAEAVCCSQHAGVLVWCLFLHLSLGLGRISIAG